MGFYEVSEEYITQFMGELRAALQSVDLSIDSLPRAIERVDEPAMASGAASRPSQADQVDQRRARFKHYPKNIVDRIVCCR